VVGLPGDNESVGEIAGSYLNVLQFGLPDTYYNDLVPIVESMTPEQANAAARKFDKPDEMTWVIVGDLSVIEKPIRALGIGEITVLDADGKVLR
jgi:zinc protease